MAAPTDLLAAQLDKLSSEFESLRKDALDRFEKISHTLGVRLERTEDKITSDLNDLRRELISGKEALTMSQASLREDVARFEARTETLINVFNRMFGILVAVAIALVGSSVGIIWGASRLYHTVEVQSQRLERVEKSLDYLPKIQDSIDRLQKTIAGQQPNIHKP